MKILSTSLGLGLSSCLIAALAQQAFADDWDTARAYTARSTASGQLYVSDELLIGVCSDGERERVIHDVAARGAQVIGEIAALRVLRVQLEDGADPRDAALEYAAIPGVDYAEPNDIGAGGVLGGPNDTSFPAQWHHQNTGQLGGLPGADIESIPAWDLVTTTAPVVLAILDTGIDFSHPEFSGRLLAGFDFVNEDADPTADNAHGVWCAGLAAANANNSFGVAGVDHTCLIYPIKVLNASNNGTVTDLVQALNHCAQQGVDVVSMSLINFGSSQTLENGLIAARNAGCILIACGGNGGIGNADVTGPGQSDQTISIGWTDKNDQRSVSSGTGAKLDFVAPGVSVVTVDISHNNLNDFFSGCSASTPVAAGIVCVLKAQDPTLTQAAIYALLQVGAEDQVGPANEDTLGRDNFFGWGRLNLRRSLESLKLCTPPEFYGTGKTTSLGTVPILDTSGVPRLSVDNFKVHANDAIPGALVVLFYGSTSAAIPWFSGTLLVAPPLVRLPSTHFDVIGQVTYAIPIDASMVGTQRCYQAYFRDVDQTDGTGVGMTNAVTVNFCP